MCLKKTATITYYYCTYSARVADHAWSPTPRSWLRNCHFLVFLMIPRTLSFPSELLVSQNLYCAPRRASGFNPLTTEFFPPRQHIFMHSAHTTFVGTPLPQHSLLGGQTWWGPHGWRDPSGNTVNDIHDPLQAQQSEVKGGCQPDFRPAFP